MGSHGNIKNNKNLSFLDLFNILYKESIKAFNLGEVPVASLIYDPKQKKIISKAHNFNKKNHNPCDHAEVRAITKACKKLKVSRLDGLDIFCSLEPCLMCSSIILHAKIRRVYFALEEKKMGALVNNYKLAFNNNISKRIKVYYGFSEDKFSKLLKKFFKKRR